MANKTNKTNKLTVAQTLEVVCKVVDTSPDVFTDALNEINEHADMEEFTAKIVKMYQNASKASTPKEKGPSKAQIENLNYAKQVLNYLNQNQDTILTLAWVKDNIKFVTTSQKASAIVNVLLKNGSVVKTTPIDGHVAYKLADKA